MFANFTKNTQLNTEEHKKYIILKSLLIVIFVVIWILFGVELIFPTYKFGLTGELSYRIKKPTVIKNEVNFDMCFPKQIDGIKLKIKLNKNSTPKKSIKIKLLKSYGAFLYDFDNSNENVKQINKPLPYNSLFATQNSVFITNNDYRFPFDSVETVLASGYNFDNMIKANKKQYSVYKKGKLLNMSSYHIPGTVFETIDTNEIFIVTNSKKLKKIKNSLSKNKIKVMKSSRKEFVECKMDKAMLSRYEYTCNFNINPISNFPGKRYSFYSSDINIDEISDIKMTFYTKKTYKNFKKRLEEFKIKLNNKI